MRVFLHQSKAVLKLATVIRCNRFSIHQSLLWPSLQRCMSPYSTVSPYSQTLQSHCVDIFDSAVQSVSPTLMVHNSLSVDGNVLRVLGREYRVNRNVYVAAFGKAVIGMIRAADDILGDHLIKGCANVPVGIQEAFRKASKSEFLPLDSSRVVMTEGAANNMPDEAAHQGAMQIYQLAQSLGSNDILLVLISGGGSALLPAPIPPLTLDQMAQVTRLLSRNGATILELNTIRKNLELLKGGGLAEAAAPAKVVSLILSDVIGDPLDFIASGPTVRNSNTPQQCLDLLHTFGIESEVPEAVLTLLHEKASEWSNEEQLNSSDVNFEAIQNEIVGSNKIAVAAAYERAESLGYIPHILSTSLDGEAEETGRMLTRLGVFVFESLHHRYSTRVRNLKGASSEMSLISAGVKKESINEIRKLCSEARNMCKPVCVIAAGETTVNVRGKGRGGRNQQLALSAAIEMDRLVSLGSLTDDNQKEGVFQLLSAGTDGQDGPTPVAGAMADPHLMSRAFEQSLNPQQYLQENDTFSFFSSLDQGRNLVNTGLTGTNVMDIQIMLINPKTHADIAFHQ